MNEYDDIIPPHLLPTEKEWQEADEEFAFIVYTNGYSKEGVPFWAYVAVPPSKLEAFKKAELSSDQPLANFGNILQMGIGEAPPEYVEKEMKEKYNINPNLEKDIILLAQTIQKKDEIRAKKQAVIDKFATKYKRPDAGEGGQG